MKINLIKSPVLTAKTEFLKKQNLQYTFDVHLKLNKLQIKNLIQNLFKVNVVSVNTHCPPRKKKVLGASRSFRPGYKRVIITLKPGDSLTSLESTDQLK